MEQERLQKIIAACGVCSRRKAEELITQGRVTVNGTPALLGDSADPDTDLILLDGAPLKRPEKTVTYLLYKPRGCVTTAADEKGRKTVLELVPQDVRLFPVGRLDLNSEGLLLLTNDGALAERLTHPRHTVRKVYHVWVSHYRPDAIPMLQRPIVLDGTKIRPPGIRLLSQKDELALIEITIREGKNRQIRRMCERAGLTVTRLKRVAEGSLTLGDLKPGEYRLLSDQELQDLIQTP